MISTIIIKDRIDVTRELRVNIYTNKQAHVLKLN